MLYRFYEDVIALKPGCVNIMGGCNDFLCHRKLKNVQANMVEMISDSLNAGIIPVLCTEIPVIEDMARRKWSIDADYKYAIENANAYRDWILSYSSNNNILCIDFYKLFMENLISTPVRELYIDGLHPSEKGHKILAREAAGIFSNLS